MHPKCNLCGDYGCEIHKYKAPVNNNMLKAYNLDYYVCIFCMSAATTAVKNDNGSIYLCAEHFKQLKNI